jgi:hypothetical protein
VPSLEEWRALFNAERDVYGLIRPLMAPGLTRFGNVQEEEANGFNLLPTGQMQRWKLASAEDNVFSNSILEDDEPIAMLWTRDRLTVTTKSLKADEGAISIAILADGSTTEYRTPKAAGLVCRCIKDE